MNRIAGFRGPYWFLSNFYSSKIMAHDLEFPTAEHLYHWYKTNDPRQRDRIRIASTPAIAKRLGRSVDLIPGWDDLKVGIMRRVVEAKFEQNPHLMDRLLDTGDAVLEEANHWGDTFWGTVNGRGSNHLGQILMDVRTCEQIVREERRSEP